MKTKHFLEAWYHFDARFNPLSGVGPMRPKPRINITLTTVPNRFHRVHIALASLLNQHTKPDRILLWVGLKEKSAPKLPKSVERLRRRGLKILFRPDIGPHTKLLYALREFPDDIHVIADDDRIYPRWWLAGLYAAYQGDPTAIHCYRAHGMRFNPKGMLRSYVDWHLLAPGLVGPSMTLFQTGTGGVLYPPRSLHPEVFNQAAIRRLCPHADDVWFKAMSILRGVPVRKVQAQFREFPSVSGTQKERLWNHNRSANDIQINAVFTYYDLYKSLRFHDQMS